MKYHYFGLCLCQLFISPLLAQTPAKPGLSPSIVDQKKIDAEKRKKEIERRKEDQAIQNLLREKLHNKPPLMAPAEGDEYTHPGVVLFNDGEWQGSDNIYNISNNISIGVELIVPDEAAFPLRAETIKNRLKSAFQSAGITPVAVMSGNKPPLPFFNVVILAQSINKGYAIYCAANLLEEVDVKRVRLEQGVWQAITWDRQHLIITSNEEASFHVNKCIDDIAMAFVKLFRHYQSVRPVR